MQDPKMTVTAWLSGNVQLVNEHVAAIKSDCRSKDDLLSRLLVYLKQQMADKVVDESLKSLNTKKLLKFLQVVEIALPSVKKQVIACVLSETPLISHGEFLARVPEDAKKAAHTKALKEAKRLIKTMGKILSDNNPRSRQGITLLSRVTLLDIVRALDAALNGGSPNVVVLGLSSVNEESDKIDVALKLISELGLVLSKMPQLKQGMGRNDIAMAFYCTLFAEEPPEALVMSFATLILKAVSLDFAELASQKQLF